MATKDTKKPAKPGKTKPAAAAKSATDKKAAGKSKAADRKSVV